MDSWYRRTLQACTDTLLDEYCIAPKVKDMMDKMFAKGHLTERQWVYIMETAHTSDKMRQFIAYLLHPTYKNIQGAFEYLVTIITDEQRPDISKILTDTLAKMKPAVHTCDVNKDFWMYQKTLQQCRRTLLEDYSIPTQVDCLMDRMMEEEFLTISQRQYIHEWGHTLDKVRQLIDFLLVDNYKDIKGAFELLLQVLIDDGRSDIAQLLKDTLKKTKTMTPEQEENIKSVEDIHELVIRLQQQIRDQEITGKDLLRELKRIDDTFDTFKVSHMDTILQAMEEIRGTSLASESEDSIYTPDDTSMNSSISESGDLSHSITKFDNFTYTPGKLNRSNSEPGCLNSLTLEQTLLTRFGSDSGGLNRFTEGHLSTSVGGNLNDKLNKLFTSVLKLCEEGATNEQIKQTLTQFLDSINTTNENHQTLLMLACRDGHIKLVRILLTIHNIDVNKKDIMGRTALFYSILAGNVEIIMEMFKCDKIDTQQVDNNNFSYILYIFQTDMVIYLSKAWELNMMSFSEYVLDGFIAGMDEVKATLDWTKINTIVDCLLAIEDLDHTDLLKAFLLMGKEDIVLRILQKGNVTINQQTVLIFVTNAIISGNKNCLITLVDFPTINLNILPEEELYVIVQCVLRHNCRCVSAYMLRVINDLNIDQHKLMAYKLVMSLQTLKSDAISFLLDSYNLSNLRVQDEKGNSVYTLLCKFGSPAVISEILHRSDIDFTECHGDGAFMMSLQNRCNVIPNLLLEHPNAHVNVNHCDPSGVTNLHQACNTGSIEIIEVLISDPDINVNAKDAKGLTAMMDAYITGRTDVVSTLLKSNKVNFDLTDDKGRNALMLACGKGDLEMVGSLVTEMKDLNAADKEGRTCLMFGCRGGNWEVVELLLAQDTIHVNAQDCDAKNPLFHSIEARDCKSTELLLKSDNIDLNKGDNEGKTPLIFVCDNSDENAEKVVAMLVANKNIDVNRQDCQKKTALSYAVERGNDKVAKIILQPDIKVNVTTKDVHGMSAFLYGCETGNEQIVFSLLETNQINVNEPNAQGITPFEYAYKSDNMNILARLLQTNEIDVNRIDSGGEVALTHAARHGKESIIVDILLNEPSINVNAIDTYRKSALIYATMGKNVGVAQGQAIPVLSDRVLAGHYEGILETLVERDDLDINYSDTAGKTAFIYACQGVNLFAIWQFIERDDLDINHSDGEGKTGFIHACQGGYVDIVDTLMDRDDLDINHSDVGGKTGLIHACQGGYDYIVHMLASRPARDINHSDAEGKTAFIYGCESGHYSAVERLIIQDELDINHSDSEGKTALIHACQNGNAEIVELLVTRRKDINKDCIDINGKTAYMYAQEHNDDALLQVLHGT